MQAAARRGWIAGVTLDGPVAKKGACREASNLPVLGWPPCTPSFGRFAFEGSFDTLKSTHIRFSRCRVKLEYEAEGGGLEPCDVRI